MNRIYEGQLVLDEMKKLNMDKKQFCEYCDITEMDLENFLNDSYDFDFVVTIKKISDALHISPRDLFAIKKDLSGLLFFITQIVVQQLIFELSNMCLS